MPYDFFNRVPLWAFVVFIELITLLPIEVGQRFGARRRRRAEHEPDGPVGSVVGAALVLLGFIVALTLGAATTRFDSRKEALIDGVNAIETAYRNALLLPDPHAAEVRALLRQYVEIRLEMPKLYHDAERLRELDGRVRMLMRSLFAHAEALAKSDRNSEVYAMFTSSLNEVFQIHNKRIILGGQFRIPILIWVVLFIETIVTMFGVGFQFGLVGNRSWVSNALLALTFALVMVVIFELDQAGRGLINVSSQPMYDLHERMTAQP